METLKQTQKLAKKIINEDLSLALAEHKGFSRQVKVLFAHNEQTAMN